MHLQRTTGQIFFKKKKGKENSFNLNAQWNPFDVTEILKEWWLFAFVQEIPNTGKYNRLIVSFKM